MALSVVEQTVISRFCLHRQTKFLFCNVPDSRSCRPAGHCSTSFLPVHPFRSKLPHTLPSPHRSPRDALLQVRDNNGCGYPSFLPAFLPRGSPDIPAPSQGSLLPRSSALLRFPAFPSSRREVVYWVVTFPSPPSHGWNRCAMIKSYASL